MEDFISVGLPNGDLNLKFQDGTSAVLEYSNARPALEFFTSQVSWAKPSVESKSGNRACYIALKSNGKEAVLQFFGKAKEQANTLCLNYTKEVWKSFLCSLSLVRLIRPDGTFSVVLCLPGGNGIQADNSFEACTF